MYWERLCYIKRENLQRGEVKLNKTFSTKFWFINEIGIF